MDYKVTITAIMKNMIDEEDLEKSFNGNSDEFFKWVIEAEGIYGLVNNSDDLVLEKIELIK